ncbi:serine hydrolase [Streptomyces erythrogriseus]|uniref:Beta-lactamase class A catalytic domain-containing protein n=1 Tax=Streptomyces erythrogriseus TaxID=284027 RepID=A0ABN3X078_9ACTN
MTDGPRVSAAALDLADGETYASGGGVFVTASVVKVDILTALLLTARDAERELTAAERAHAEAMIVRSDNDAATALWQVVGRAAGLDAANARLGLTRTVADARWGLTRTTAADRVRLLRQVFAPGDARAYVRELMERVVPEQAWGVPALADPGTRWAVKNGWLPRDATGLWVVNSTGCVTVGGRVYTVAVLSDGHASMAEGVARVEEAARDAVRRCGGAAAPTRAAPAARMPAAGAVAAAPLKGAGNCATSHALPAPANAAPPPPRGGAD